MIPLHAYIETILNPSGRFKTLDGIFAVRDKNSAPVFNAGPQFINIRVRFRDKEKMLKCFLCNNSEIGIRLRALEALKKQAKNYLCPGQYYPGEMVVFDTEGRAQWVDVILEDIPDGASIDEFALLCGRNLDAVSLQKAFREFAIMSESMYAAGISHGRIKPSNIFIDRQTRPMLINYYGTAEVGKHTEDDDSVPLAVIALLFHLLVSSPPFIEYLSWQRLFQLPNLRKILPDISRLAQKENNLPLFELATLLSECKNTIENRCQLNKIISDLAELKLKGIADLLPEPSKTIDKPAVYYDEIAGMSDTLRAAMADGKWSFISSNGKKAIVQEFDYCEDFYEGRAVVSIGDSYGLIDRSGKYILPMIYEEVRWAGRQGVAIASMDGKSTLHNRSGERIGDFYDWMGDPEEGLIAVGKSDKYGYIDIGGNIVLPMIYDNAYDFREGIAVVEINHREVRIDRSGSET